MDDYIPLHICDDLFPQDITAAEMQNRIVIRRTIDNQDLFTLIRDPGYSINKSYR